MKSMKKTHSMESERRIKAKGSAKKENLYKKARARNYQIKKDPSKTKTIAIKEEDEKNDLNISFSIYLVAV